MSMPEIKGIAKAGKPRFGTQSCEPVWIALRDRTERDAAWAAAKEAAGLWAGESLGTFLLRRPLDFDRRWPGLGVDLWSLQDRCHRAAVHAVKRLRDPDWKSDEELQVERVVAERAMHRRKAAIVGVVQQWLDRDDVETCLDDAEKAVLTMTRKELP